MKVLHSKVIEIRAFEETILELFSQNKLSGTTHTYIGEEATAVALMNYVTEKDVVFSNHRCHGHYLAYGGPAEKLLAEIMSRESGLCQGKGGSQHIRYKNMFTNGIQGGIVPNALGVAFAKKLDKQTDNTIVFVGDGTLGQGVVYEAMNIAAAIEIPLMFIVEDNQYAMSTARETVISGDIAKRVEGFAIKTFEIESTDVEELLGFFNDVFEYVNTTRKPVCAVIHNYRLGAHSKGDDTRDIKEIEEYKKRDPMVFAKQSLGEEEHNRIYMEYKKKFLQIAEALENEKVIQLENSPSTKGNYADISYIYNGAERCVERIQQVLKKELKENKDIIIFGEDVCDPYGGAFKVTKGLSTAVPQQIFNMPISEACMTGMAVGLALAGKKPILEMMFGDFITLGFDQLLNHASKYGWVYDDVKVPMIVRAPMGGKRGYGPTHSQSLEKFLIGIPLLRVLALSYVHDPAMIYEYLLKNTDMPTVVIENKKLYAERIATIVSNQYEIFQVEEVNNYGYSTLLFSIDLETTADYVLITYGGMVRDALQTAEKLMLEDEIQVNVMVISQLAPLPIEDIKQLLRGASKIVFVEEGTKNAGIGAEVIASCTENKCGTEYIRIAAYDCPIPNGIVLENQVIPNERVITERIRKDYYGK